MPRKVAIFTGNRAEYGLLLPLVEAVAGHPDLDLELLVSGAHLAQDFGYTAREIAEDGYEISREIAIEMGGDDLLGTVRAIGTGVLSVSEALHEIRPDWMVVYADRFEAFAAMIASTQMRIPTAHIEGGDITEGGALDDSVRHAMTKLAHVHFTTNEQAAERVRLLGEEPWRVHNVGLPTIDLIAAGRYASPDELAERYGIDSSRSVVVFTQHSVATEFDHAREQIAPSLAALEKLAHEGVQVVMTYPNNDAGGRVLIEELRSFADSGVPNVVLHPSLGRSNYHGLLALIGTRSGGACVGNSSSGIKETPAFGCPTVNIGSRQDGRLRSTNIIEVGYDSVDIYSAVRRCIDDRDFVQACRQAENPYGHGDAGRRMAEILARTPLVTSLIRKRMTY